MNHQVILVAPIFAFLLMLIIFFTRKTEMVYLPLHKNLDSSKYEMISIDTVYNDTLDYKIVKYKER